jgi:aryl-alcohol dehydrogenase-like predicted oxidoreductase
MMELSPIGFGCAPMGGYDYGPVDEPEVIAAVHAALDLGITLFDTAGVYGFGRAEEILGRALAGHRDKAVIATKVGLTFAGAGTAPSQPAGTPALRVTRDSSASAIRRDTEASLRRLGIDTIDLLQVHWPDPNTPLEETAETLAALVREGKARFVGYSNFSVEELARVHVDAVQVGYNLLCRDAERTYLCHPDPERSEGEGPGREGHEVDVRASRPPRSLAALGMTRCILAHSTLARGALGGHHYDPSRFAGNDTRARSRYFSAEAVGVRESVNAILADIAAERDVAQAAVAVRWVIEQPGISSALVGFRSPTQVREIAAATTFRLSDDERERLSAATREELVMSGLLAR